MKNGMKMQALGALALLTVGLFVAGCKSAPPLDKPAALALIQAKYDSDPAEAIDIVVGDDGMRDGVTAGYWAGKGRYPNGYWADFTITPTGLKVLKQTAGGDTIQWRPDSPSDKTFNITMTTLQASHPKAQDLGSLVDSGDTKTASFTEAVNLEALPAGLQTIAHDKPNKLTSTKIATFSVVNGAWQLSSIQ